MSLALSPPVTSYSLRQHVENGVTDDDQRRSSGKQIADILPLARFLIENPSQRSLERVEPIGPEIPARSMGEMKRTAAPMSSRNKLSAGILAYRREEHGLLVLLVHPGGPFWRNKDDGAWSIPKGEIDAGEDTESVARREFMQELGSAPAGPLRPLGEIRQRGGKRVHSFALQGDLDV